MCAFRWAKFFAYNAHEGRTKSGVFLCLLEMHIGMILDLLENVEKHGEVNIFLSQKDHEVSKRKFFLFPVFSCHFFHGLYLLSVINKQFTTSEIINVIDLSVIIHKYLFITLVFFKYLFFTLLYSLCAITTSQQTNTDLQNLSLQVC